MCIEQFGGQEGKEFESQRSILFFPIECACNILIYQWNIVLCFIKVEIANQNSGIKGIRFIELESAFVLFFIFGWELKSSVQLSAANESSKSLVVIS